MRNIGQWSAYVKKTSIRGNETYVRILKHLAHEDPAMAMREEKKLVTHLQNKLTNIKVLSQGSKKRPIR